MLKLPAWLQRLLRRFKRPPVAIPLPEPWFDRVQRFSDEICPLTCTCDHQLYGTGVFYQSIGVIQCATCHNWQIIRKPVK